MKNAGWAYAPLSQVCLKLRHAEEMPGGNDKENDISLDEHVRVIPRCIDSKPEGIQSDCLADTALKLNHCGRVRPVLGCIKRRPGQSGRLSFWPLQIGNQRLLIGTPMLSSLPEQRRNSVWVLGMSVGRSFKGHLEETTGMMQGHQISDTNT